MKSAYHIENIQESLKEIDLELFMGNWPRTDRANAIWFYGSDPVIQISNGEYTVDICVEPVDNEMSGWYIDTNNVHHDFGPCECESADDFRDWLDHSGCYTDYDVRIAEENQSLHIEQAQYFVGRIANAAGDLTVIPEFTGDSLYDMLDIDWLKDIFANADKL